MTNAELPADRGGDPDTDFQAAHAFEQPFIGIMTAIGWIARRDAAMAFEIGFWRFCDRIDREPDLWGAQEELWRKLQLGEIKANGVDSRGDAVEIPPLEWRHLEFAPAVDSVSSHRDESRRYSAVAVETAALIRLWPRRASGDRAPGTRVGRRPDLRLRVEAAMRRAVAGGYDLAGATEEELKAKFDASRNVVRPARQTVLSEINSGQFRTKDN